MAIGDSYQKQVGVGTGLVAEDVTTGNPDSVKSVGGAAVIYGLARNIAAVAATATYNATEILGYRVLTAGSGNWSLTPIGGSAITGIVPGGFTAGQVYPEHLSSLTVGTGGAALVYIP